MTLEVEAWFIRYRMSRFERDGSGYTLGTWTILLNKAHVLLDDSSTYLRGPATDGGDQRATVAR